MCWSLFLVQYYSGFEVLKLWKEHKSIMKVVHMAHVLYIFWSHAIALCNEQTKITTSLQPNHIDKELMLGTR